MNEKVIFELINYISKTTDISILQSRLEQYHQGLEWLLQEQKWDLVIELADAVSSYFVGLRTEDLRAGEETTEQISERLRSLWQQGREFARQGLLAATQTNNRSAEIKLLANLSRLSGVLEDFEMAVYYAKEELQLTGPTHEMYRWRTAKDLEYLGNKARHLKNFLAAETCFQASLEIFQKLENKAAMIDVLAFMGVCQEESGNPELAKRYFDQSNELRSQLKRDNQSS